MVYAYPTQENFAVKKRKKKQPESADTRALREYYETHDISIVRDDKTGKLVAKVESK